MENKNNIAKISNFHTHTFLCHHAEGTPEDYILQASKDGCIALGITDHCPFPVNDPKYSPHIRMDKSLAPWYVSEIRKAAEKVDFPVYVGFECEWNDNNEFATWYKDGLLGEFGADYLVFGCHWGKNRRYVLDLKLPSEFHEYTDLTIHGIRSGLFKFIAHPDLMMSAYKEWDSDIEAMCSAIIDAAIDCNMPLEVNGNGFNRPMNNTARGLRHQYPYDEFWELALKKNAKIICNSDAHNPAHTILWARDVRNYAIAHNLKPLDTLDF